jgi:endonuclease/exonuclease/phosphatase family metal-dependent hydrolase
MLNIHQEGIFMPRSYRQMRRNARPKSPCVDHIFIKGNAKVEAFGLLSYKYSENTSNHYPILADINI